MYIYKCIFKHPNLLLKINMYPSHTKADPNCMLSFL